MTPEEIKQKVSELIPDFKAKDVLLLTGAGFTKNFGGFLAREMHSKIFNHKLVQESDILRNLLVDDYDFESVYWEVLNHGTRYSENDQNRIKQAVEEAYHSLDEATKGWVFNSDSPHPVNVYGIGNLINTIASGNPQGSAKSIFFTLNQDLFMERHFGNRWPGIQSFTPEFYGPMGRGLEMRNSVIVPDTEEVLKKAKEQFISESFPYLKLHGSYGWKSADGSNKIVIGKNKTASIAQNLILFWYFQIFANAIFQGNKKLLIIGYGFGDEHVNKLLAEAVEKYGLKIYIISTQSMEKMTTSIKQNHSYAIPMLKGIRGYYPYTLLEIFPANQSETEHIKEIKKALFT